ncbi:MAG: cache domain-containing protein [Verrucomicrobiota bacterium]
MRHLFKAITFVLICLPLAASANKNAIVQHAHELAKRIERALHKNELTQPQIYTYLTEMVTFDDRIYGSALAFNPSFLHGHAFFLEHNVTEDGRLLYSPYIFRNKERLLKAIDIGNISEKYGYDYASWDWYKTPMETQQPNWTKPYFDDGGGGIEMVTYSIPIGEIAILTFDLPHEEEPAK